MVRIAKRLMTLLLAVVMTAASAAAFASASAADIKEAQKGLKTLGYYSGSITGRLGDKTEAAVRAFQKAKGLSQTGNPGPKTLTAIRDAVAKKSGKTSSSSSSSGSSLDKTTVRVLQKQLKAIGYYYGNITGNYGEKTERAVKKYQQDHGLTANGKADYKTRVAIERSSKSSGSSTKSGVVYNLDWYEAKKTGVFPKIGFAAGKTATLKDLTTGKTLNVRIQSSGAHLDVEPLTAADTKTFCQIYGVVNPAKISARRRPMLLTTSHGYQLVCSCYGTPHGDDQVKGNNYTGQFCLHFQGSKTSGTGKVDSAHQRTVSKAAALVGRSRVQTLNKPSKL